MIVGFDIDNQMSHETIADNNGRFSELQCRTGIVNICIKHI